MRSLVVIGDGGHSQVVQEMALEIGFNIVGVLDDRYEQFQQLASHFVGPIAMLNTLKQQEHLLFIHAIGDNAVRQQITEHYRLEANCFATCIHPTAFVSKYASIQSGTVVMPYAVVHTNAYVGHHCIINTAALVEHDNYIADYVHICPNVALAGNISIGELTQIGIQSTVIQNIKIGKRVLVGAGSVVIKPIEDNQIVAGCPAKILKSR